MVYGCGKFSEDAWTALVTAESDRRDDHVLSIHLEDCPICKAEFAELSRIGFELRKALGGAPEGKDALDEAFKQAFVASVMSEVSKSRRERESFIGRLVSRPAGFAVAAALTLAIVAASGTLPWRAERLSVSESTGYTAPGGTILSLSERTEALAAALTTHGVAVAAAASAVANPEAAALMATGDADLTARAIRAPLGVAAATAQVNES